MIRIRDRSGMNKAIPQILGRKFGFAILGGLIEAYCAPTALDVALIVLEGGAELAAEVITSNYDPNDDHYNSQDNHGDYFLLTDRWFTSGKCKKVKDGRPQAQALVGPRFESPQGKIFFTFYFCLLFVRNRFSFKNTSFICRGTKDSSYSLQEG